MLSCHVRKEDSIDLPVPQLEENFSEAHAGIGPVNVTMRENILFLAG